MMYNNSYRNVQGRYTRKIINNIKRESVVFKPKKTEYNHVNYRYFKQLANSIKRKHEDAGGKKPSKFMRWLMSLVAILSTNKTK